MLMLTTINVSLAPSLPYSMSQVSPVSGPTEGGTMVTIQGLNLGLSFSELRGNVEVAGVACTPQEEGYITAEQ